MKKAVQNNSVESSRQQYKTPVARVFFAKAQSVFCQSGNEPMCEDDYGDAGFHEV